MKIKKVNIVIFLLIVAWTATFASAQDESKVETYISGQKYQNVDEYKKEKIRQILEENKDSLKTDDGVKAIQEQVVKEIASEKNDDLSNDELKSILKDIRDILGDLRSEKKSLPAENIVQGETRKNTLVTIDPTNDELKEMQEMLSEYKKTGGLGGGVVIDPRKMKTVEIKPDNKK